jgi:hypothetical protein
MVAVLAVGMVVCVGLARLGAAAVGQARADGAADAAALAAADMLALGRGATVATDAAGEAAMANGARLLGCSCGGPVVTVRVAVRVDALGVTVRGRARAEVRLLGGG